MANTPIVKVLRGLLEANVGSAREADSSLHGGGAKKTSKGIAASLSIRRQGVRRR